MSRAGSSHGADGTYGAVVFHSTSAAIRADKTLRKAAVEAKLIPTPREISSDCGLALRISFEERDDVVALLTAAGVEIDGVHRL
jgi:hypothetical protein